MLDTTLVTTIRLLEGRPISQGGRDHSSHRLVRFGMSEKHAVLLLALIATALGGTSLAYNVLDDQRLAIVGVLVTFVLLVQFASFLADVERRNAAGADVRLTDAFAVHWRRLIEVVVDFGLIVGSFAAAYVVRFGWPGTESQRHLATIALPVLVATRYLAFIPFGLYRSIWRYAGSRDLDRPSPARSSSRKRCRSGYVAATHSFGDFSRSFFIIDALFCAVAISVSRLAERAVIGGTRSIRDRTGRRTLIVGAGRTGRSLLRELRETGGERVLGFVDDNPRAPAPSRARRAGARRHARDRGDHRSERRPTSCW